MSFSIRIILFAVLIVLFSCRKEDQIFDSPSAKLQFSTDSISFDTVFTTVGTSTELFMVYNPYKEAVKISEIKLRGGNQSTFRINVDGRSGTTHKDIMLAPNDSMFVFVEATVDPNNQSKPFVIDDEVVFTTNGNRQEVKLVAWGQNAIYFTPTTFSNVFPDYSCLTGPCSDILPPVDVHWTDSLPIVIYGYVVIDSLDKLTIDKGAKIYFHNNGGLWVFRGGTLKVEGTKDEPVIFQGDRLDPFYSGRPGQWDRIWINEGGINDINYAIIKNAFIGIQAEVFPFNDPPYDPAQLNISNTIIDNSSSVGLLSSIFKIKAENLLITNSGDHAAVLRSGGEYSFTHCSFANYFSAANRETPSFLIQNSFTNALGSQLLGTPRVKFYNSILDGKLKDEFDVEVVNNGSVDLDFQNSILKTQYNTSDVNQFKNIYKNPSAGIFANPYNGDFELDDNSPAIDKGEPSFGNLVPLDLKENDRTTDGHPDLGVYEYQP